MRLVGSVIARNEIGRYWQSFVDHLLEFVDEVRVWDDGSTDGGPQTSDPRVVIHREPVRESDAFHDHAASRNRLIGFTLEGDPTWILNIDCDEFIADGQALRAACADRRQGALKVCLQEVWNVKADRLEIREDGGWKEHDVALLWRPDHVKQLLITDRGHATGRVPDAVARVPAGHTCTALLHLGWARHSERDERFARYAVGDAGKFHAKAHIDSIMWPDGRVRLEPIEWPDGWSAELHAQLLEKASS